MRFPDGEPCAGCATRKGTEASKNEATMATFRECVKTGEPFMCHESCIGYPAFDGGATRLCRGWVNIMNQMGSQILVGKPRAGRRFQDMRLKR